MLYYLIYSSLNKTSAAFRVGGPDAYTYLQGQITQDLNRPAGAVGYGLFLNPKGKVLADGYALRLSGDEFWLLSLSLAAPLLRERLEACLVADEVSIEDETDAWARISLWGDQADDAVTKLTDATPGPGVWIEKRGIRVFRGRGIATDYFELLVPRAEAPAIGAALSALGAGKADADAAERERILRGVPLIPADIGLNDLPNEGGLDEVAISYTKGCYLGQEVMARLKNLGQVRRRLHLVHGRGKSPGTGALLFQKDKKVGEVRTVARDGNGFVAMAMLSLVSLREPHDLSLLPDGPANISVMRPV